MARKKEDHKKRAAALRQCLEFEYGSSIMDLIDDYARGLISDFSLALEIGNSGADLAREYKKALAAAETNTNK